MAKFIRDKKHVVLLLSLSEAEGLFVLAGEGAEGILTDESAAKGHIGSASQIKAATAAFETLQAAIHAAQ